jgi:uncharacterized membrane protein YgcG
MLHQMFCGDGMADFMRQMLGSLAQPTAQLGALTNLQQVMKAQTGQFGGGMNLEQVRQALNSLAAGDATKATDVHLSDMKNHFYAALPAMKENILAELKGKGMYSVDPRSAHLYVLLGVLSTVVGFVLMQVLMHVLGVVSLLGSPGLFFASAIIAVVIIILFARIMTAKSQKGVDTKVEILGFQEFINRVDSDRLKRMPPDTFEKFLPYAMALGIENRWAKAFQGILQNPPNWYVGQTPDMAFNPIFFADSMHSMATVAHEAFVAAPRASSTGSGWSGGDSGGGGGGGSSGGGFGGGGGDAF